jgi:hypothetical protein
MSKYKGQDSEGNAIIDELAKPPEITYVGSVKLHGTNASIIAHEDGSISFHSKSTLLGRIDVDGEFTLNKDNFSFAQEMNERREAVFSVVAKVKHCAKKEGIEIVYPLKISGEWCGPGIQSGVGISALDKKSFFVFGVRVGDQWLAWNSFYVGNDTVAGIYDIFQFPHKYIKIDFCEPALAQNILAKYTEEVEEQCPVTVKLKEYGVIPEDASEVGEGLVWVPEETEYVKDSDTWFKTKGQKHSVTKVKTVAQVDVEKLSSIVDFVDYVVTENRLNQGLLKVGLDRTKIGEYIKWVSSDVNDEESDTLEKNNLTMKDVGKYISNKAREFYLSKLNEV